MDVDTDIFDQKHFNKEGGTFDDAVLYIKAHIDVDDVALIKLTRIDKPMRASQPIQKDKVEKNDKSLTLQGVKDNYITFNYINK